MENQVETKYRKLSAESESKCFEEHDEEESLGQRSYTSMGSSQCTYFILLILFMSLLANLILLVQALRPRPDGHQALSPYAGLEGYKYPKILLPQQEFVDETNLTATSLAWEALSGDPGVVALSNDFVAAKQLPGAMRYPWDSSKGVYLIQGFHNLHCIRTIYRSIMDYHFDRPQKIALIHILHCLDELRRDVLCHADDTPRYAGLQDPPGTGKGQAKMCRDWNALQAWALENTACFRHEDEVADRIINRFKFCPNGSQPWLEMTGAQASFEGRSAELWANMSLTQ